MPLREDVGRRFHLPKAKVVAELHRALLRCHLLWCNLHALLLHFAEVCFKLNGACHRDAVNLMKTLKMNSPSLSSCSALIFALCKCLVGLESSKCVAFSFKMHSSTVGGCIINEGHPVAVFFACCNREMSTQIHVNKLKWL